jgi:alpha-1,3-glucosyltransferase
MFPFARGLFEDKVANFWCAVSPFLKLRTTASLSFSAQIAYEPEIIELSDNRLLSTVLSILPGCISLFRKNAKDSFCLACFNISLGFFLFSFQVHEKSILIPLLPVSLLAAGHPLVSSSFHFMALFRCR